MLTVSDKVMTWPLWIYIVGWIFFVYLFTQIVGFDVQNIPNILISGMYFVEFGVHEASHIVFAFLPAVFVAAAGSFGEISFTLLLLFATLKAKAYFASIFAALWVMLAMNSVGNYMADARAQSLPLIGPGDTVKHDWNFVFGELGWLNNDMIIGRTVTIIGDIIGVVALLFGVYLIITKIIRDRSTEESA